MEAPLTKRIVAVLSSLGGGDLLDRGSYELYLRTVVIILANWVADKSHFTHQLDGQEAVLEELYSSGAVITLHTTLP